MTPEDPRGSGARAADAPTGPLGGRNAEETGVLTAAVSAVTTIGQAVAVSGTAVVILVAVAQSAVAVAQSAVARDAAARNGVAKTAVAQVAAAAAGGTTIVGHRASAAAEAPVVVSTIVVRVQATVGVVLMTVGPVPMIAAVVLMTVGLVLTIVGVVLTIVEGARESGTNGSEEAVPTVADLAGAAEMTAMDVHVMTAPTVLRESAAMAAVRAVTGRAREEDSIAVGMTGVLVTVVGMTEVPGTVVETIGPVRRDATSVADRVSSVAMTGPGCPWARRSLRGSPVVSFLRRFGRSCDRSPRRTLNLSRSIW